MALSKKKSCELSIKEKVLVIKQKESEGKSQRELVGYLGKSMPAFEGVSPVVTNMMLKGKIH